MADDRNRNRGDFGRVIFLRGGRAELHVSQGRIDGGKRAANLLAVDLKTGQIIVARIGLGEPVVGALCVQMTGVELAEVFYK